MEKVKEFLSKDKKHDTTVHENINPAVQNERVTRTQHNEAQTAVDREVHQDHHHTTVQPIHDREVLPEQHSHKMHAVEHRDIKHGDHDRIHHSLQAEKQQFKNTQEIGDVQHTHQDKGAVVGEHHHHHIHENIQPVIQKETVQPSVVHTTKPVHEVHHHEAKHHNASTLPSVSMAEFQKQGGSLGGAQTRTDAFAGEPDIQRGVGAHIGGTGAKGTTSLTHGQQHDGGVKTHGHQHATGVSGTHGASHTHGTTTSGNGSDPAVQHTKPSLMDKLNPMKDADGDGKKGFMK